MSGPMVSPGAPGDAPHAAVSPKVTAGALGALGASVALALLTLLGSPDGAALVAGLPSWATVLIVAALPPVVSFVAGYAKNDPARR